MIRLVTFDRLSLLHEEEPELRDAVAALSSTAAVFDQHVLQSMRPASPLDVIGNQAQQDRFAERSGDSRPPFVTIFRTPSDLSPGPPGFDPCHDRVTDEVEVAACLRRRWTERGSHPLQWIHVMTDRNRPTADIVAALQALHALTDRPHADDTLIVTALAGSSESPHHRFESLLYEDRIRVPLWLRTRSASEGRCARLSGSHDILETILCAMANEASSGGTNSGEMSLADPLDLEAVFRNFDTTSERALRIDLPDGSAVRTNDFLLVCSQPDGGVESSTALYSKPYDMWNVHDVSHEYPDVVQHLLTHLNPT